MTLTHAQRRQRRQNIAASIAEGYSAPKVAHTFGVSLTSVYNACQECGVVTTRHAPPSSFKLLAHLLRGESHATVARSTGANRSWVSRVAKQAREAGIVLRPDPTFHANGSTHTDTTKGTPPCSSPF